MWAAHMLLIFVAILLGQVIAASRNCSVLCTYADPGCFSYCAGSAEKFRCPYASPPTASGIPTEDDTLGELLSQDMQWFYPGMEHMAQGVDIVSGKETGHPILTLRFCSGHPDPTNKIDYMMRGNKYRIPYGMHLVPDPTCSLDATTELHSYASSLSQSMAQTTDVSITVSGNVGYRFVKASATAAYSQSDTVEAANSLSKSGSNSFAVTSVKCNVAKASWVEKLDDKFGFRFLHPDFEAELNAMSSISDAKKLVQKYGTHFYGKATLGGKLEQVTTVSDSLFKTYSEAAVSQQISKSLSASIQGGTPMVSGGVSGSVTYNTDGSRESVNESEIATKSKSSSMRSYGGVAFDPTQSSFENWASSVDTLPVPIDYQLVEIYSILPRVVNSNQSDIRSLWRDGVTQYMEEYGLTAPAAYQFVVEMDDYANKGVQPDGHVNGKNIQVLKSDSGELDFLCNTMNGFAVSLRRFLFCHNSGTKQYSITELINGKLALAPVDEGILGNYYDSVNHYEINGKHYFLMGSNAAKQNEIRALDASTITLAAAGTVYDRTKAFPSAVTVGYQLFPVKTQSKYYAFMQDTFLNVASMQQLNEDGTMSPLVENTPRGRTFFDVGVSFIHQSEAYFYAQSSNSNYWEVRKVSDSGTFAEYTTSSGNGRGGISFVVEFGGEPFIYSRGGNNFYLQTIPEIISKVAPKAPFTGTTEIVSGLGTGFPAGDNSYYMLQDSTNKYIVYTIGDASGNKYGPYAYRLMSAPGELPIMPRPSVFTDRGSIHPKYFTKGNRIVELDVNVKGNVKGDINTINIYSLADYLPDFADTYVQKYNKPDSGIRPEVSYFPIRWMSVFDIADGKQRFFTRQGDSERFMPAHSINTWNETTGILYRTDRWFYEVVFYIHQNATNTPSCTNKPAIQGLFEITLTGSANTATWEQEILIETGRPKFSWKFNSTLDIGTISDLSIRAIWGQLAGGYSCTVLAEIRVVDLHDTVFVTSFKDQGHVWQITLPQIPVLESDVSDDEWLAQTWGLGTFETDGTLLAVSVSPWSSAPVVEMIYGYSFPNPGNWSAAVSMCSALGGQIASEYSALQLAENGFDTCEPVWVGSNTRADELFYAQTDQGGQNYQANAAQPCYYVHKANSTCGGNTAPFIKIADDIPYPLSCSPLCIGPYPSNDAVLRLWNVSLIAKPVPLHVTFGYEVDMVEYSAPGSSNNSTNSTDPSNPTQPGGGNSNTFPPEYPIVSQPSTYGQKIQYKFSQETQQFFVRLNISYSITPITGVDYWLIAWTGVGSWRSFDVDWQADNMHWVSSPPGGIQFPLFIRMHAAGKDPLIDEIPYMTYDQIISNLQFPF